MFRRAIALRKGKALAIQMLMLKMSGIYVDVAVPWRIEGMRSLLFSCIRTRLDSNDNVMVIFLKGDLSTTTGVYKMVHYGNIVKKRRGDINDFQDSILVVVYTKNPSQIDSLPAWSHLRN